MKTPIKINKCSCGCKHPKLYTQINKEKIINKDGYTEIKNWFPVGDAYFGIVKCNVCGKKTFMMWGTNWENCAKLAINSWNNKEYDND